MLTPMEVEMMSRVIGWVLGAAGRMTAAPCPQEVGFYRVAVGRRAWGSFPLDSGEAGAALVAPPAGVRLVARAFSAADASERRAGLDQLSTHS